MEGVQVMLMLMAMLGMFHKSQQRPITELMQSLLGYASQAVAGGSQRSTKTLRQLGWEKQSRGKGREAARADQEERREVGRSNHG